MACPRGCCATYREHITSLAISYGPTRETVRERRLDADLDAFKRMAESGHEPRTFVGAANLASGAESPVEIERGHLIKNDRLRREVEQAHANPSGAA